MNSLGGSGWDSTRGEDWCRVRGKWDGVQEVVHGTPQDVGGEILEALEELEALEAL